MFTMGRKSFMQPMITLDLNKYEDSEAMEPSSPIRYELTQLVPSDEEHSRNQIISVVEADITSEVGKNDEILESSKNVIEDDFGSIDNTAFEATQQKSRNHQELSSPEKQEEVY